MTSVTPTTQIDVLNAVRDRLIDQIDQVGTGNVYVTASATNEPPANMNRNLFLTVSPTSGTFDESEFLGGGNLTLIETTNVIVVIWNAIRLDRTGEDKSLLTHDTRGLFVLKHEILRALTGHPLKDVQGNLIVTTLLQPLQSETARSGQDEQKQQHLGDLGIVFRTQFHWDLT